MSNSILPHLLSDSPPPLEAEDEDFEDEFGDFKVPDELSFDNETLPMPSSLNDSKTLLPNFSGLSGRDNKYETESNNINSEPPHDYFSIWEQIENNVPEFIDTEQVEEAERVLEDSKNEEPKKIITTSDVFEDKPTERSDESSNEENKTKLKDYVLPGTLESFKESTENLNSFDSINSSEENNVFESEYGSTVVTNNIVNEIQLQNTCEQREVGYVSKENDIESVGSKHNINFNIINEKNEIQGHSVESIENDICHHPVESNGLVTNFNEPELQEPIDTVCEAKSEITPTEEVQKVNDEYDDFADFSSFPLKNDDGKCEKQLTKITEDEFGRFQNNTQTVTEAFSASKENVDPLVKETEDIDDFEDFTCYAAHKSVSNEENSKSGLEDVVLKICSTPEEAFKETQNIIEKLFPKIESTNSDYSSCDFIMNNSVFDNLKDITETNALTYQWDKSTAQKNILKTLNIDVRNILYGPNWNSGVPIFASNLCEKPLEPIKSEFSISTSPQKNVEAHDLSSKIPQFDWAESGFSNLQDSLENMTKEKLENIEESSNVKTKILQPSIVDQETLEPKLNSFEATNEAEIEDFGDFTSYQGNEENTQWNMLPLRESHISNQVHQENTDTDKISKYFRDLTMGKTEALDINKLKPNSKYTLESFNNDHVPIEPANVFSGYEENADIIPNQINFNHNPVNISVGLGTNESNDCDISTNSCSPSKFLEKNSIDLGVKSRESGNDNQEDEFTDFQSSLPPPCESQMKPALLEPLKPAVLRPEPIKHQLLKIEWPEPGLDEEEINRIVNGVVRKSSTNENVMHKIDNMKSNEQSTKSPSQKEDHEDWSDFMSVKEPLKTRTSTPDLPLSVFNLGSIQTNRVSAPYVAPNGVVHSPSKTSLSFPVINRGIQNNSQHLHQQPFITSQAFNALYSNTVNNILLPNTPIGMTDTNKLNDKSHFLTNKMKYSKIDRSSTINSELNGTALQHVPSSINHSVLGDDDWGDFVSAPSTVSQSNSNTNICQPSSNIKTTLGCKSGSFQKSSIVSKNTVVRQQRKNLPIISTMPDLDFISPKSRSTIK